MRWPDSLDIGVGPSGDRCIKRDTPTEISYNGLEYTNSLFESLNKSLCSTSQNFYSTPFRVLVL